MLFFPYFCVVFCRLVVVFGIYQNNIQLISSNYNMIFSGYLIPCARYINTPHPMRPRPYKQCTQTHPSAQVSLPFHPTTSPTAKMNHTMPAPAHCKMNMLWYAPRPHPHPKHPLTSPQEHRHPQHLHRLPRVAHHLPHRLRTLLRRRRRSEHPLRALARFPARARRAHRPGACAVRCGGGRRKGHGWR